MILFRQIGPGALVWYLGLLGVVQATRGDKSAARATLDELWGILASLPSTTAGPREALAYVAQTALILSDSVWLARISPQLSEFEGQFGDLLIDRLLGEIAIIERDWAAAERHLDSAEALARRGGLRPELARTLVARARLVIVRGDRSHRGHELAGEAATLFEEMENDLEARNARALVGIDQETAVPARRPAGLSEREAEVLSLVGAGKTNREIAELLVLSEKTVENHLTSIYRKIGAENRATAVAFAVRQGLA
jgi:DNA-binding CsgD family transcriptional regulator